MKKVILRITLVALTGFFSLSAKGQMNYSCNPEVVVAVETQMSGFLESIPPATLLNFGIETPKELDASNVGSPLAVYHITDGELVFGNTWRVPIIIDNKSVALFTVVEETPSNYKVVDFGATLLASEIEKVASQIDVVGILRVYDLREDFLIVVNSKGKEEFVSISRKGKPSFSIPEILYLIDSQ